MEVQDQVNPEISRRVERVDSSDSSSDVDSSSSSDSSGSVYSDSEDSDATTGTAGTALGGIDAVASSTSASTSTTPPPMPVAAAVAGGGQQQQQLQSTVTQRPRCGPSPEWHDYFLHSKDRISGLYNVPDAIEFVGQKHCCNGVLIYGTKISSEDYRTLLDGRTLEVSKRLHIIINSPQFHLFFFILHIKPKPWKEFFKEFLIFDEHTITTQFSDRIQDRRRSPPLKAFVEDCVTRLTEEDQDILFQLNLRLEDNEKIRIVSLVLRYGWDFVLNEIRVGGLNCYEDLQELPLFNMTTEEFKTKYGVVDINDIIKRSTTPYGQYLEEIKQDPNLFEIDDNNNSNTSNNNTATRSLPTVARENESDDDIGSIEGEILDEGDTDNNFGDGSSMVRILLSLCRSFCSILFIGFTYIPFS